MPKKKGLQTLHRLSRNHINNLQTEEDRSTGDWETIGGGALAFTLLGYSGTSEGNFSRFARPLILTRRDVRASYLSRRMQAKSDFTDS
ncbi:hypothetical protein PUN28_005726 [Cardiocondyla obscurior]|uniref:Uncharacterized protein n=1 Tax=Cardiocondyla obscurior TaxID=286306 RepID=A0AAW2G6W9_9HYME